MEIAIEQREDCDVSSDKEVVEWKIIRHLQGCADAFELCRDWIAAVLHFRFDLAFVKL